MTDDTPTAEYYGFLGRVQVEAGTATLRFYACPVATDEGQPTPVFEIVVEDPDFNETDMMPFMTGDIEVLVYPTFAQIDEVCDGLYSRTIHGTRLTAVYKPYDLRDYAERVDQLAAHNIELQKDLGAARLTRHRLMSVVVELLRRAEIKAGASEEHRLRQAAAIDVLQRMRNELQLED